MNETVPPASLAPEPDDAPPDDVAAAPPLGRSTFAETFYRTVPAFDSLRHYSLDILRRDLVAGITVAAVAVPQAMAYALIAGVPPQYGLYTAMVMTAVGALFDSSKQLINGPTNAISIAVLSALAMVGDADKIPAAVLLALLVGLIQTTITLFRLGDLSRYISNAVIVGFTVGAGVLLFLDQLKNLLGLEARGAAGDHFLKRFWLTLFHGGPPSGWTMAFGLGTMILLLALRWLTRRARFRVPDFLLAVVVTAGLVWAGDLHERGVAVVGAIPRELPTLKLPTVEWKLARDLSGSALAIAVLGLLEAIAMAKAIAAHTGQKLDINQQCLSEGLANLSGSLFQCFPGSGSLTRSAINHQAGGVTQWSGVISAVAVGLTVLLFAPLARYIPRSALAGILLISAWHMVDRRRLLYHLRATRYDVGIVLATALAGVFISIEFCILIGTFLSFLFYVPRAARVHMTELVVTPERVIRERVKGDPRCDRLLLFNLEGELFFGSAPDLERHLSTIETRTENGARIVVLRLMRARNPDAVCLELLEQSLRRLDDRGVTVFLCGVRHDMAKILRNVGIQDSFPRLRIFREGTGTWSSTLDAVRAAYELLGSDLCPTCPRRGSRLPEQGDWYYMI